MTNVRARGEGEPLRLTNQSGIVVSLRMWSETDVSGVVWSNGGHISSSKTEVMQVFLQQEDGREIELKINNAGIGARVGNFLSMVWASSPDSSRDVGVALVNQSTGRRVIFDNRVNQLLGDATAGLNGCLVAVGVIIAAMIFGSWLGEFKSVLIAGAALTIPVSLVLSISKTKGQRARVRQSYIAQIEAYIREIQAQENRAAQDELPER